MVGFFDLTMDPSSSREEETFGSKSEPNQIRQEYGWVTALISDTTNLLADIFSDREDEDGESKARPQAIFSIAGEQEGPQPSRKADCKEDDWDDIWNNSIEDGYRCESEKEELWEGPSEGKWIWKRKRGGTFVKRWVKLKTSKKNEETKEIEKRWESIRLENEKKKLESKNPSDERAWDQWWEKTLQINGKKEHHLKSFKDSFKEDVDKHATFGIINDKHVSSSTLIEKNHIKKDIITNEIKEMKESKAIGKKEKGKNEMKESLFPSEYLLPFESESYRNRRKKRKTEKKRKKKSAKKSKKRSGSLKEIVKDPVMEPIKEPYRTPPCGAGLLTDEIYLAELKKLEAEKKKKIEAENQRLEVERNIYIEHYVPFYEAEKKRLEEIQKTKELEAERERLMKQLQCESGPPQLPLPPPFEKLALRPTCEKLALPPTFEKLASLPQWAALPSTVEIKTTVSPVASIESTKSFCPTTCTVLQNDPQFVSSVSTLGIASSTLETNIPISANSGLESATSKPVDATSEANFISCRTFKKSEKGAEKGRSIKQLLGIEPFSEQSGRTDRNLSDKTRWSACKRCHHEVDDGELNFDDETKANTTRNAETSRRNVFESIPRLEKFKPFSRSSLSPARKASSSFSTRLSSCSTKRTSSNQRKFASPQKKLASYGEPIIKASPATSPSLQRARETHKDHGRLKESKRVRFNFDEVVIKFNPDSSICDEGEKEKGDVIPVNLDAWNNELAVEEFPLEQHIQVEQHVQSPQQAVEQLPGQLPDQYCDYGFYDWENRGNWDYYGGTPQSGMFGTYPKFHPGVHPPHPGLSPSGYPPDMIATQASSFQ